MSWKHQSPTDIETEKEIITAMITNTQYLKEIQQIYHPEMMQTPYSKIIAGWCLDYFKKYNTAPESEIQELFNSYSNKNQIDETQSELIARFLSDLSNTHEKKTNIDYRTDKARGNPRS